MNMPKVSEEHREARRDQIINAMLRCVAREGFHKTTMAAVIKESGLSAGAVYLYFKGKEDLIRVIAETLVSEGLAVVQDSSAADDVPPPHQVIRAALERIVNLSEQNGVELHRVALQTWAEAARNPEVMAIYQREGIRGRAGWAAYVESAIAAGHLPKGTDPVRTAHALIGLIPGFMVQRLFFEDLTPETYAAGLADLMAKGKLRSNVTP